MPGHSRTDSSSGGTNLAGPRSAAPALLEAARLKELVHARADGKTLSRMVVQLGLFALSLGTLLVLDARDSVGSALGIAVLGAFSFQLFALYAPFHECTHRTAFSSKRANVIGMWVTGIFYGYSPGLHTEFHFTHHRQTNKDDDPEAGFSLPPMPLRLLWQALFAGVLGAMAPLHSIALAVTPTRYWDNAMADWVAPAKRARIAWECRAFALIWILGGVAVVQLTNLGLEFLLALVIARTIHGVVTVSEHEGLGNEGRQVDRTRTVATHALFRWFWWNMNYHSEHHAWASIPWHQLPAAYGEVRDRLPHLERGYLGFLGRNLNSMSASPSASDGATVSAK